MLLCNVGILGGQVSLLKGVAENSELESMKAPALLCCFTQLAFLVLHKAIFSTNLQNICSGEFT